MHRLAIAWLRRSTIPCVWTVMIGLLLLPAVVSAWGGDGHQIVALIAEKHLTPEASVAIHELLGKDVDISDAEIASWADQIKRERPNTRPWHYANIPADAEGDDAKASAKPSGNLVEKIDEFEKVLAAKNASKESRVEALKFLVHLIGDVHQPLHCAERNGDKGGNGRLVYFLDKAKAVSLHEVWDSLILLHRKGKTRILDYAKSLNAKITDEMKAKWEKGSTLEWANEGNRVAVEAAYKDVAADGDPPKLDRDYVDKNSAVIDEQLEKAGIRLARVLNQALSKKNP